MYPQPKNVGEGHPLPQSMQTAEEHTWGKSKERGGEHGVTQQGSLFQPGDTGVARVAARCPSHLPFSVFLGGMGSVPPFPVTLLLKHLNITTYKIIIN